VDDFSSLFPGSKRSYINQNLNSCLLKYVINQHKVCLLDSKLAFRLLLFSWSVLIIFRTKYYLQCSSWLWMLYLSVYKKKIKQQHLSIYGTRVLHFEFEINLQTIEIYTLMCQSNRNFNIPPPANLGYFNTLFDWGVANLTFPSAGWGKLNWMW